MSVSIGGHQRRAPSLRRLTPLPPVKRGFTFTQEPVHTGSPLCGTSAGSSRARSPTVSNASAIILLEACGRSARQVHMEIHVRRKESTEQQLLPAAALKAPGVTRLVSLSAVPWYVPRQIRAGRNRVGRGGERAVTG